MAVLRKQAAHENSFDIVRLVAALAVVFGHLYPMAGRGDPLYGLWGTDEDLGGFAVLVFFGISGYLITDSILNGATARFYIASRLLRIYPALVVCLVICIIVGAALTRVPFAQYFSKQTFQFFAGNVFPFFWQEQRVLPGVFPPPWDAMDGPLWTIKYELACYILAFGVYLLPPRQRRYGFFALSFVAVCVWLAPIDAWEAPPDTDQNRVLRFEYFNIGFFRYYAAIFFLAAVSRIVVSDSPRRWLWIFIFLGIILVLFRGTPVRLLATLSAVAMAGVCLGNSSLLYFNGVYRRYIGDLSYATYLYGWPISLICLYSMYRLAGFWPAAICSVVSTLIVAWCSWRIVERPALRLKSLASVKRAPASLSATPGGS